jgi:hypothetical protein
MAVEVRARGNEGQARVCARRAAGAVLREYFQRRGLPVRSPSAYDLWNYWISPVCQILPIGPPGIWLSA